MGLRVAGKAGRMTRDLDRERRIRRQVWITYLVVAVTAAVAVGLTVGHVQQTIAARLAQFLR
jgi:hypothetical protein